MKIRLRNLSFGYAGKKLFDNFSADFGDEGQTLAILGPSGCGKTTLLKLLGGLLKPETGEIRFFEPEAEAVGAEKIAFMFQEPRLLPWFSVLENICLPLEKFFGKEEGRARARRFLSLVSLDEKEGAYPTELSGGQAQRVSLARAFAWPAPVLFMDEPFQSLDIPLRISLMETCLSILEKENSSKKSRFLIAVTHDPREAIYMGGRIIVLGRPGEGIVFDRIVDLPAENRIFGAAQELEKELIRVMR
jgi:NitT/TauT family transport system ATP-binding protein